MLRSLVTKGGALTTGVGTLGAGVGAAGAALASVNNEQSSRWMVPEGYAALRTRWKKVRRDKLGGYDLRGPGPRLVIPGSDRLKMISTQIRPTDLEDFNMDRREDNRLVQYKVSSSIIWRVLSNPESVYNALYKPEDGELGETVSRLCVGGLITVMESIEPDRMRENQEVLRELQLAKRMELFDLGVEVVKLSRLVVARSIGEMLGNSSDTASSSSHLNGVFVPEVVSGVSGLEDVASVAR